MVIKVFIYNDDSKRRDSLRSLLNLSEEFEVVGEAFNCEQVEKEMNLYKPDVVLMDINMPVVNGIEGLKYIAKNFPEIRVLIQTAYDDDEKIFEAIKNGANGYILKSDSANKILQSIDEVYRGGAAMNPAIAMRILSHFQPQEKKSPLTAKESNVLELLSEGLSYKMVADQLGMSYYTINSHSKSIYEKLHISSLGEAIAYYYKNIK